ncbi:hypothetical protein BASA81_010238 [Batrachochytrium salamandrivorans]|nr:hypothetical protein BASA81_010238 [Batrachochytrium salamandrivorans]
MATSTVIITGAGSGIGAAAVEEFLRAGYNVFACDWNVDGLSAASPKLFVYKMDVSKESEVRLGVSKCVEVFGRVDCVFANAGVSGNLTGIYDLDGEDIDLVFRVNVNGVLFAFKHVLLKMQELGITKGSLIATSSVAGLRSGAGGTIYSASKAAVVSIVQTVANQLMGTQIRCNAICPGIIQTGMTKPLFDLAQQRNTTQKIGQLNPLQRFGDSSEVARVALFLASDQASYVTGQAIAVDGGLSSSHPVALRRPGKASM